MEKKFDVLIVGAGPAGTAAAICLGNTDLSVGLLDKATFPRDKICGDALSVDVVNQLRLISPDLWQNFLDMECKTPSSGVQIYAPDGGYVDIPFIDKGASSFGYVCRRIDFDNLLLQHCAIYPNVTTVQNCELNFLENGDDRVHLHTTQGHYSAKMVIGADGAHSLIAKHLGHQKIYRRHHSAGLRMYYEGITGMHTQDFIELHFLNEILPGYLWIFPLPNNCANVGIGMLSSTISRKGINLKRTLTQVLETHPDFEERFSEARPLEIVKGYGLPLGSKQRKLSGERILLAGDAAGLIDPFTGEGIANAIRSGRIAAKHAMKAFANNNFSAAFSAGYDREIFLKMGNELKLSHRLQLFCRIPPLFNYVVKKANRNEHVHRLLIDALAQVDKKKNLIKPSFYYNLLFDEKV